MYIWIDEEAKEWEFTADKYLEDEITSNAGELCECTIQNKTIVKLTVMKKEKKDN